MIIRHQYKDVDYILSNENLQEGDKVYPISRGRTCEPGNWKQAYHIHYNYDFRDFMSGFPDDPHIIVDLAYSTTSKAYQIHTDHGFGPIEMYYKIIVSMNKSDYIVDRIEHPKTKQPHLRIMDKISHSVVVIIGPKKIKAHQHFVWAAFLSENEWNILKAFRTKVLIEPRFSKHQYELTDVLNEKI